MTREELIALACRTAVSLTDNKGRLEFVFDDYGLESFAAAIATAEREACARLVEPSEEHRRDASWGYIGGNEGVELLDSCAAAIRARGNSGP